jgi:hypothetical protein
MGLLTAGNEYKAAELYSDQANAAASHLEPSRAQETAKHKVHVTTLTAPLPINLLTFRIRLNIPLRG